MSTAPRVSITHLSKRYGSFVAVNDISFDIRAGEIFGFLGINGAGKTTTLKMLAGVLQPSSGSITIEGYDITLDPVPCKQMLGYIPDRPHLYGRLTGREYLYFVADLHSVPLSTADERIDRLLREYALAEWEDELVESYSHGMKQRLATCGALIHQPKLLIVDEPMVGLDPHGAKLLKDSLRSYARDGMSVLLSTHSLNVAEELCDRLAIIDRGAVLTIGTLEEVRARAGAHHYGLEQAFLALTRNLYENGSPSESVLDRG